MPRQKKLYSWMVLHEGWKPPLPAHGGTRIDTDLLGRVLAEKQRLKLLNLKEEEPTNESDD
jgi:hypothetical protein